MILRRDAAIQVASFKENLRLFLTCALIHYSPVSSLPMTTGCPVQLTGDELLPSVDIVGRPGEGRIGHDVYGERGNVGR